MEIEYNGNMVNVEIFGIKTAEQALEYLEYIHSEKYKDLELKDAKTKRFCKLEQIFNQKWIGIQALIINKPWMTNPEAIKNQIDSYSKLGIEAEKKLKTDKKNATLKSIVKRHNEGLELQFNFNLLMQQIRGALEVKIEDDAENVDELLTFAENIKLKKEDLTAEKIAELQSVFNQ